MKNSDFEKDGLRTSTELRLTPLKKAEGGTCNTYETRLFGKKVFVKEIKPEFAGDARMLSAFRKEAEIGFRLDHRNIPKYIYAEGVLPSERYIVQEFIDGQTLTDFIKENPTYFRNKKNVERFVREFIDVIDYLHRNQIVHLDLKPDNILISRIGRSLKLVDLGFCASDFFDDTRGLTHSEVSPEGIDQPGLRGAESDYFGIGKILTFLRTNTPGFPKRKFKNLENRLLIADPSKRLTSLEEIEKILKRSANVAKLWIAAAALTAIFILAIVFNEINGPSRQDTPAQEALIPQESPHIEGTEAEIKSQETSREQQPAIQYSKENMVYGQSRDATKQEAVTVREKESESADAGKFSYQTYEKLKAEMRENINKNFAGFGKMVSSFIREGKYSEKDYNAVTQAYRKALHKTFETTPYKSKYKDLSPSVIDDTMAEVLQEMEKKNWGPNYEKYIGQYQASLSGSSK